MSLTGAGAPFYRPHPGDTYVLEASQVDDLARTYGHLSEPGPSGALKVAIARFNFAYEKSRREDKLIDYWVALEALFLPGISDELSFRASLRIAYFLGVDTDDRQRKYKVIKDSYNARSWIVHGERTGRKAGAPDIVAAYYATEKVLRESLRLCVINPGEPSIEKLDDAIVRGIIYRTSMRV